MKTVPKPVITEADFLSQVIDLAHIFSWKVAHFRPAMTKWGWRTAVAGDGAGFPDCVFARERIIWAELKTETGQPTLEQYEWLAALAEAGQEVYLWRPDDIGEIIGVLQGTD